MQGEACFHKRLNGHTFFHTAFIGLFLAYRKLFAPLLVKIMNISVKLGLALGLASLSFSASALTINAIGTAVGTGNLLSTALLAPNSGITVLGDASYRGTNDSSLQQSGTYSGFTLVPADGAAPTLAMGDGIVLTTGSANVVRNNTQNNFGANTYSGGDDSLAALHGNSVFDANVLGFSFSVGAGTTSVSAQFVFGSEEFPTQQIPDVFGFFVDGVNYAVFADGSRISNNGDSSSFIANPVDGGRYGVEYNGLTKVYTVTGLLNSGLTSHTISIGIADTWDGSFDSGVFLSSLKAGTARLGGIDHEVPEPAAQSLLGLGLAGLAVMRRRA